jgi:hypothetical protein
MPTYQDDPVISRNTKENPAFNGGIYGESTLFNGVRGVTYAPGHGAVVGVNSNNNDDPNNPAGPGVYGFSKGTGVHGDSDTWNGVAGISKSTIGGAGVYGESVGPGVIGKSQTWHGVYGETPSTTGGAGVWGEHKANGAGVVGKSNSGVGVYGTSESYEGVHAETKSTSTAAMAAYQLNPSSDTAAFYAKHAGNRTAAVFEGNVNVTGHIHAPKSTITCFDVSLSNADCAEDFNIGADVSVEPGTVMVLGEEEVLLPSHQAYDKRVAGVISGAGNYKPGIVLDKQESQQRRLPVALLGKVFCKVDAQFGAIAVGDLLTSSSTLGHAMKATDPLKAFGSVIGKALRPLPAGKGLIPILIALQ